LACIKGNNLILFFALVFKIKISEKLGFVAVHYVVNHRVLRGLRFFENQGRKWDKKIEKRCSRVAKKLKNMHRWCSF